MLFIILIYVMVNFGGAEKWDPHGSFVQPLSSNDPLIPP